MVTEVLARASGDELPRVAVGECFRRRAMFRVGIVGTLRRRGRDILVGRFDTLIDRGSGVDCCWDATDEGAGGGVVLRGSKSLVYLLIMNMVSGGYWVHL